MNTLEITTSKLEVLRSSDLTLSNNSLEFEDLANDRLKVKLNYSDTTINVTFLMQKPLDFALDCPELISMDSLENSYSALSSCSSSPSMYEMLKWIRREIKQSMKSKLEFFPEMSPLTGVIDALISEKLIDEKDYDLKVDDEKVIFIIKSIPEEVLDLQSFNVSMNNNKIVNGTKHYYLTKLVFRTETGQLVAPEFCISFSSCIGKSFPGLKEVRWPDVEHRLVKENLVDTILALKEATNDHISHFYRAWQRRAQLLVRLYYTFQQDEAVSVRLDTEAMTRLQLGFRLPGGKLVLEVRLGADHPATPATFVLHQQRAGEEEVRRRPVMEAATGMTPNMTDEEFLEALYNLMNTLSAFVSNE